LARRAANGAGVNFCTGEFAHPRGCGKGARRRAAVAGAAAAALAVLGLNAGEGGAAPAPRRGQQERLTAAAGRSPGRLCRAAGSADGGARAGRRDEETRRSAARWIPKAWKRSWSGWLEDAAALDLDVSRLALSRWLSRWRDPPPPSRRSSG
jgi:hypothetical protein